MKGQCIRVLGFAISGVVALPMAAQASTITWANVNTAWATGTNWVGGAAPGTADDASFPAVASAAIKQPAIATATTIADLVLDNSGGGTYSLGGAGSLTLNGNASGVGLTVSGGGTTSLGLTGGTILGANQSWSIGAGTTVAGKIVTAAGNTLTLSGAGTLTPAESNTYAVNYVVNAGTLLSSGYGTLGTGTATINGGTLAVTAGQGSQALQGILNNGATLSVVASTSTTVAACSLPAPIIGSGAAITIKTSSNSHDQLAWSNAGIMDGGGGSSINVTGNGQLLLRSGTPLAGHTAYTGSWTINAGASVQMYAFGNLLGNGANMVYLNGGTLEAQASSSGGAMNGNPANPVTVQADSTVRSGTYSNAYTAPTSSWGIGTLSIGAYTLTADIGNATTGTLTTGNTDITFGATALTGNATFNVVNPGYNSGLNTTTLDLGAVSGVGRSLTKTGSGILRLSGAAHTYSGNTNINAGTLALKAGGSIANSPVISIAGGAKLDLSSLTGSFTVGAAQTLTGHGTILQNLGNANGKVLVNNGKLSGSLGLNGVVRGAGSIEPGSSAGILTAGQVNPADGLHFNFEMTAATPTYGDAIASGNDLLRLTDASSPFAANLTSANAINVYFNVDSLASGGYAGGFFTDKAGDFLPAIQNATFTYYYKDSGGSYTYNGANYALLDPSTVNGISTLAAVADFGAGTVNGQIAEFTLIVPEPVAFALAGLAVPVLMVRRRRIA